MSLSTSLNTLLVVAGAGAAGALVVARLTLRLLTRARLRKTLGLAPEPWPLDEWIDQRHEEAIDPDMEIIDPHHHLWDPRLHPKGWGVPHWLMQALYLFMSPAKLTKMIRENLIREGRENVIKSFGPRQLPFVQSYMGKEFLFDIKNRGSGKRGHNIVKTVYVECGWEEGNDKALAPVGEARAMASENALYPSLCNAIVAHTDLRLPDVERALQAYAKMPLVKGVRHALAWCRDPDIACSPVAGEHTAADPEFRHGFGLLERYGLSYDTWMFHEQLPGIIALARSFPGTTIIINHVAEPLGIGTYTRQGTFPVWEKGIRELAKASKNVHVKLSGLGMIRTGFGFNEKAVPPSSQQLAEAWGPYFRVVLEAFGIDRCMFASNFPVDKVSTDYTVMWNAFKVIVKDYSEADKRLLFYENARRVYKL